RHGQFVAAREADGQIDVHEERLEDLERPLGGAEPAVGGDGAGAEPPSGDGVGEFEVETGAAVVVGDEVRPPRQRLGEVVAYARRFRKTCSLIVSCGSGHRDSEDAGLQAWGLVFTARHHIAWPVRASPSFPDLSTDVAERVVR